MSHQPFFGSLVASSLLLRAKGREELPAAGAALHVLVQVWDELVSGLEQIQTSPEGLDVVLASSPSHRTVLEGSWTRTFTVLSFLPQCPLPQKARSRAGVGSHWH